MKLELIPVVKYWEYNSKEFFSVLKHLRENNVSTLAAWVPWSHLETDRQHLLQKFVKQAWTCGFKVHLGITPELGSGYSSAGIPDDLIRDRQNHALDRLGNTIYACVPPNIHPLVSLLAPQVFQRYGHFLLKFSQEILETIEEGFEGDLEITVTDSFFKNYRNSGLPESDHGDYSLRHLQFAGGYKKEDWTPMLQEKIFLARAMDFLKSRFSKFKRVQTNTRFLFGRDTASDRLMEELMATGPNQQLLFEQMLKARSHTDLVWFDDLRAMRDRERNFLVSSSLMMYGQVWIGEDDYFSLSIPFRKRVQKIIEGYGNSDTKLTRSAIAFVQNRFSPAQISCQLREKLGASVKFKTALNELNEEEKAEAKLYVVEEGYNLELNQSLDLFNLASSQDSTVVIFRSSLCKQAFHEFHKLKTFRLNHGWIFEIGIPSGGGQVLLIEGPENAQLSMDTLGESLLSVAKIDPLCEFEKKKSKVLSLDISWDLDSEFSADVGEMSTVVLMNPQSSAQKINLSFKNEVRIHGLKAGAGASTELSNESLGKNFETEMPPLSVVPISVFAEKHREELLEKEEHGTAAELE